MQLPLKGIIPPLVTPLNAYHELDISGLEKLIEHQLSGGVHGLFILALAFGVFHKISKL